MYNILDNIDFQIEELQQQYNNCSNESTKSYLLELIKIKQEEYNKIEKEIIERMDFYG